MEDTSRKNRSIAYKLLAIEAIITCVIAFLLVLGAKIDIATSVLIGGLAFIIPNTYFVKYVFRYSAAESPRLAVRGFYIGEAIKLVSTVLVFTAGFLFVEDLNVPALILTYVIMLVINLWGNSVLMSNPAGTAGEPDNNNGN